MKSFFLLALLWLGSLSVQAHEPYHPEGRRPDVHRPPMIGHQPYYVSGYYEMRTETILVAPEHVEKQYVPPVYETRVMHDGTPVVIKVADGYYREVVVPARYITQQVRVWHPGYWSASPVRSGINFSMGQRDGHTSWGLNIGIGR